MQMLSVKQNEHVTRVRLQTISRLNLNFVLKNNRFPKRHITPLRNNKMIKHQILDCIKIWLLFQTAHNNAAIKVSIPHLRLRFSLN